VLTQLLATLIHSLIATTHHVYLMMLVVFVVDLALLLDVQIL
jgi:hypothetical protein